MFCNTSLDTKLFIKARPAFTQRLTGSADIMITPLLLHTLLITSLSSFVLEVTTVSIDSTTLEVILDDVIFGKVMEFGIIEISFDWFVTRLDVLNSTKAI